MFKLQHTDGETIICIDFFKMNEKRNVISAKKKNSVDGDFLNMKFEWKEEQLKKDDIYVVPFLDIVAKAEM